MVCCVEHLLTVSHHRFSILCVCRFSVELAFLLQLEELDLSYPEGFTWLLPPKTLKLNFPNERSQCYLTCLYRVVLLYTVSLAKIVHIGFDEIYPGDFTNNKCSAIFAFCHEHPREGFVQLCSSQHTFPLHPLNSCSHL